MPSVHMERYDPSLALWPVDSPSAFSPELCNAEPVVKLPPVRSLLPPVQVHLSTVGLLALAANFAIEATRMVIMQLLLQVGHRCIMCILQPSLRCCAGADIRWGQ